MAVNGYKQNYNRNLNGFRFNVEPKKSGSQTQKELTLDAVLNHMQRSIPNNSSLGYNTAEQKAHSDNTPSSGVEFANHFLELQKHPNSSPKTAIDKYVIELSKNSSYFNVETFNEVFPRGFQKLLAFAWIMDHPTTAFDREGKFNYDKFKDWLGQNDGDAKQHLTEKYYKHISYDAHTKTVTFGVTEYRNQILLNLNNESSSLFEGNRYSGQDVEKDSKLVKAKSKQERQLLDKKSLGHNYIDKDSDSDAEINNQFNNVFDKIATEYNEFAEIIGDIIQFNGLSTSEMKFSNRFNVRDIYRQVYSIRATWFAAQAYNKVRELITGLELIQPSHATEENNIKFYLQTLSKIPEYKSELTLKEISPDILKGNLTSKTNQELPYVISGSSEDSEDSEELRNIVRSDINSESAVDNSTKRNHNKSRLLLEPTIPLETNAKIIKLNILAAHEELKSSNYGSAKENVELAQKQINNRRNYIKEYDELINRYKTTLKSLKDDIEYYESVIKINDDTEDVQRAENLIAYTLKQIKQLSQELIDIVDAQDRHMRWIKNQSAKNLG